MGGFINLGAYQRWQSVQTLETPYLPVFIEPKLDPNWYRPEMNPAFMSIKDRKVQKARSRSIETKRKFNQKQRRRKKPYCGMAIKNRKEFYHPYPQSRDKFHHAPSIGVPTPPPLVNKMGFLSINSNHQKRLATFRNPEELPAEYVEISAIKLREHVIDSDTMILKGTFGKKREAQRKKKMKIDPTLKALPHQKGFLLFNPKTNLVAFYREKDRKLVTYFIANRNQARDILNNKNVT